MNPLDSSLEIKNLLNDESDQFHVMKYKKSDSDLEWDTAVIFMTYILVCQKIDSVFFMLQVHFQ